MGLSKPYVDYPMPPSDPKERMRIYLASRDILPAQERLNHTGEWIAIRWDGAAILASDRDHAKLIGKLRDDSIPMADVWLEYVPGAEPMIEPNSEIEIVLCQEAPPCLSST
jgi:hypothetical protein